jgi:hypothetical protein
MKIKINKKSSNFLSLQFETSENDQCNKQIYSRTNWSNKKYLLISVLIILSVTIIFADVPNVPNVPGSTTPTVATPPAQGTATSSQKDPLDVNDSETPVGNYIGLDKNKDNQIIGKKLRLEQKDGQTTITLKEGGYIKLKTTDGKEIIYQNLKKLEGVKIEGKDVNYDSPTIVIDKNGVIKEAYFTTGEGPKEYVFGNERVTLPQGSKVYFKDGKLSIGVADGTKLSKPELVDKSKEDRLKTVYSTVDGGSLILDNGLSIKGGKVIYDKEGLGFSGKEVSFGKLVTRNKDSDQITYLDFEGKPSKVNGAYISMNEKEGILVVGSNIDKPGPAVMLTKDNAFGMVIEPTGHFAVKALGGKGVEGSYMIISNKDRIKYDLVPEITIVGNVAYNDDNSGKGTYLAGDDNYYLHVGGKVVDEFADIQTTTTTAHQLRAFKKEGDKLVDIYGSENYFVTSNKHEMGYGPDPAFIRGAAYDKRYPNLARSVSNRVSYNTVAWTEKGFEDYTKRIGHPIRLDLDSYSQSRMTPDKYRMMIDFVNSLPENKNYLKEIQIHQRATMGGYDALAWGGPGTIEIRFDRLNAAIIRHEATHSATLSKGSSFWGAWSSVGGGSTGGIVSSYATENAGEHASEFVGYLLYNPERSATLLKKYSVVRGQFAVLAKTGVITPQDYAYHMSNAGLDSSSASMDKYIQEARRS